MDSLKDFLKDGEKFDWEDIKKVVTARALWDEKDPIEKAFEVHYASYMRTLNFSLPLFSFL